MDTSGPSPNHQPPAQTSLRSVSHSPYTGRPNTRAATRPPAPPRHLSTSSERRQSHGTRPPDQTKRQSQMNAGGAISAALGSRGGLLARHSAALEGPSDVARRNEVLVVQLPRHIKRCAPWGHKGAFCSRPQEGQRRDVAVMNRCQKERCHAGHHHVHVDNAATQDGVHRRCVPDIHRLKELSPSRGAGAPMPVPCATPASGARVPLSRRAAAVAEQDPPASFPRLRSRRVIPVRG